MYYPHTCVSPLERDHTLGLLVGLKVIGAAVGRQQTVFPTGHVDVTVANERQVLMATGAGKDFAFFIGYVEELLRRANGLYKYQTE